MKFAIEPLGKRPFHAEAVIRVLPGLGIASAAYTHLRYAGTRELADGRDDLALTIARSGVAITSQRGQQLVVRAGTAVLVSTAETFVTACPSRSRFLCLRLQRRALTSLVPNPEDALMRPLPGNTEALRLLTHYVGELDDNFRLATYDLQRAVVTHVCDLVALVIGATRDGVAFAERRGLHAARLAAVKADIRENLEHGELILAAVAARQHLTPRHVQRLFESVDTTFSEFVLGERLARAHRLLTDPCYASRTISAIAFEAGFSDLSYFNRTFRRRYDAPPSEIRAAARREEES